MSSSAAFALSASSMAMSASAKRKVREIECKYVLKEQDLSTVESRQEYASCVQVIEPIPAPIDPIYGKALLVAFIVTWVISGVCFSKYNYEGFFLSSIMGILIAASVFIFGFIAICAIGYLVS